MNKTSFMSSCLSARATSKATIVLTAVFWALLVFGSSNKVAVAGNSVSNVNNNANVNANANNQVQNMVNGNGASGSASGAAAAAASAIAGSSTSTGASANATAAASAAASAKTSIATTITGSKVVAKTVKSLPATGAETALLPSAMSAFALAARKYLLARKEAKLLA